MRREAVAARLIIAKLKWANSSCRSPAQLAGRHTVDVGEAARGVSVQIEAFDRRRQAISAMSTDSGASSKASM